MADLILTEVSFKPENSVNSMPSVKKKFNELMFAQKLKFFKMAIEDLEARAFLNAKVETYGPINTIYFQLKRYSTQAA